MAFPATALPARFELDLDGSGAFATNITTDVQFRADVTISRGRPDEASTIEPSSCTLTLNNRSTNYSLRNPTGAYYGLLSRNTPLRVSIDSPTSWLVINAATGNTPVAGAYIATPDAAGLDVTGDIDIRFDADLDSWSESMELVSKWNDTGNQRSYVLWLNFDGTVGLFWTTAGVTLLGNYSTVRVPVSLGRLAVRATLDVDNGAGGSVVTFYTSDTISGTWTQLGAPVVRPATTSIFNSTSFLYLLDNPASSLGGSIIRGKVYAAQVRNGIGGTVVANPDFTAQAEGATSFTDSASNGWVLNGAVALTKKDVRFIGEVAAWPTQWDVSGRDVFAPIEAAGVTRRLSQGQSALQSAMRRGVDTLANLRAYWPLEDPAGSTVLASAIAGVKPMTINTVAGTPSLATNTDFASSLPLPEFNGAIFTGFIPAYASTGDIQVRSLLSVPAAGAVDGKVLFRFYTAGTAQRWDLIYNVGGAMTLSSFDGDGTLLQTSGAISFNINGSPVRVSVELDTSGANVGWRVTTLPLGTGTGFTTSGTLAGNTVLRATKISMNVQTNQTDVAVGHVTVESAISSFADVATQLNAYVGEKAGRRVQRLCLEESVALQGFGDLDDTAAMGPQSAMTLMDLLKECAATDLGILADSRALLGVAYRPRSSLYNQTPAATVPYASLPPGFLPVEDDVNTRNDITATRPSGSSYRYTLATGTMSVQPPPAGVGRYDDNPSVNVAQDEDLPDQASWRVHLGTVNEARFPAVDVDLAHPTIATSASLTAALQLLDLGDRMVVTGTPSGRMAPGDVSQLVQGSTETLNVKTHKLSLKCSPESPWRVGIYAAAVSPTASKYSSDGSALAAGVNTTATSWSIATPSGPLWTTAGAEYPFDWLVAGERVTVTAMSGTTSPQTATVTRSVNGVVKAQAINAVIGLYQPAVYAL